MPKLTDEEKVVGRAFRDAAQQYLTHLNQDQPTDYNPPNFLAIYRHKCPSRNERSTALQLKEVYLSSGEALEVDGTEYWAGEPESKFGFIYREGVCRLCKQTARSPAGRLVDARDRPPTAGKVARSAEAAG